MVHGGGGQRLISVNSVCSSHVVHTLVDGAYNYWQPAAII